MKLGQFSMYIFFALHFTFFDKFVQSGRYHLQKHLRRRIPFGAEIRHESSHCSFIYARCVSSIGLNRAYFFPLFVPFNKNEKYYRLE